MLDALDARDFHLLRCGIQFPGPSDSRLASSSVLTGVRDVPVACWADEIWGLHRLIRYLLHDVIRPLQIALLYEIVARSGCGSGGTKSRSVRFESLSTSGSCAIGGFENDSSAATRRFLKFDITPGHYTLP